MGRGGGVDDNVERLLFQIKGIESPNDMGHTRKFTAFKVPPNGGGQSLTRSLPP